MAFSSGSTLSFILILENKSVTTLPILKRICSQWLSYLLLHKDAFWYQFNRLQTFSIAFTCITIARKTMHWLALILSKLLKKMNISWINLYISYGVRVKSLCTSTLTFESSVVIWLCILLFFFFQLFAHVNTF